MKAVTGSSCSKRPVLFRQRINEYAAGIEQIGTYVDPHEAVWAPWIAESEKLSTYTSLDNNGNHYQSSLFMALLRCIG